MFFESSIIVFMATLLACGYGFSGTPLLFGQRHGVFSSSFNNQKSIALSNTATNENEVQNDTKNEIYISGVVAPLKSLGPYPGLSLKFPNMGNGQVIDFVLDTGANVNTFDARLVEKHDLPLLMDSSQFMGTAGIGGSLKQAGSIYNLGDTQLQGIPQEFTFMTNLPAAALPIPQGLLGLMFFQSFPAGVEFDWYGTDGDPPTIQFYFGKETPQQALENCKRVPLKQLPVQLLSLTITINGTELPALLDTGAPVTVLNRQAAEKAGISTVELKKPNKRPKIGDGTLLVGGVDKQPVALVKSSDNVAIQASNVSLGEGPIYVGDLPGLAFMGGLGQAAPPAVVLGLDFLRNTCRMVLKAPEKEVWFEELGDQPKYYKENHDGNELINDAF